MTIDPKGFPLDLTGELPRNLVINDERVLATSADMIFVPDGGPFYTRTLVVRSGTAILKPNVDYKCLHLLRDATVESGLDVSSVIMITSTTVSNISMNYQVIGGQYADTVPVIRQLLENADNIEKSINWNTHIYAKPDTFEPAPHFVSGEDFSDWSGVLNGLRAVERSILLKDVAAWESAFQYIDNLITNRLGTINLGNYYTKSQVNAETVKLALKTSVYTKAESELRHYTKAEVTALIGDIDGNEAYYTEGEINAKFIETIVADAKYSTKAETNRIDTLKADKSSVYTRIQSDDKYPLSINMYHKDYIDANFVIKGTSYTKAETDKRYALITDGYNKVDSDKRYALKGQIPTAPDLSKFISRDDVDSTYLKINTADVIYLRKSTADSLYAKHTDLEIIATLSKKFANYYTRIETDETFITDANAHSLFLTKVQGNSLYYTKSYIASTYSTRVDIRDELDRIRADIKTKPDTTWVNSTFYSKTEANERYYTKADSNTRYHTKQHVDTYFVNTTTLTSKLAVLTTLSLFNNFKEDVLDELRRRYTSIASDQLYYSKTYINDTLTRKTELAENVGILNAAINKKSDTTWVNTTFYNKSESDSRYYTKATIDSVIYTKLQSNATFVAATTFNSEMAKYTPLTTHNSQVARLDAALNNKYNKNETYSKSETDSRYIPLNSSLLTAAGATSNEDSLGLNIVNDHATTSDGGAIHWYMRGTRTTMVISTIDGATNAAKLSTYLYDYTTRVFAAYSLVTINGMWHRTYGWLHDYFAVRGEIYTKAEVYSKSEADVRYMTISQLASSYVSQSAYNSHVTSTTSKLNTKSDITWVNGNFYDKVESDRRYYSQVASDSRYHTKQHVDSYFVSTAALTTQLKLVTPLSTYNTAMSKVNTDLAARYTKTETNTAFYTKAQVDSTFYKTVQFVAAQTVLNNAIAKKSDTAWVNTTFYNKSESDVRYYTKATIDSTIYSKLQSDAAFVPKAYLTDELKKYTLKSDYTTAIGRLDAGLNSKYNKNETYSISEANARFLPSTVSLLTASGATSNEDALGLSIINNHTTTNDGGGIHWYIRDVRTTMLISSVDSASNATKFSTYLYNYATQVFASYSIITINGMWHRAYGNLHDYFAIRGDVYTKSEVYSKSECAVNYLNKSQLAATYATSAEYDARVRAVDGYLGNKADTSWVKLNYYTRTESNVRYYTKTEINTGWYTKSQIDTSFATKSLLTGEFNKTWTIAAQALHQKEIDLKFGNYPTNREAELKYSTITELNKKASTDWVNTTFTNKSTLEANFLTKVTASSTYALKGDTDQRLRDMNNEIILLRGRTETYKVGDIFITTTNFPSGSAVSIHNGYGTWVRHAEGRVLIGQSSNGWTDGVARGTGESPTDYHTSTRTMGARFGEYRHELGINELPSHRHSTNNVFNKFVGSALDVYMKYGDAGNGYTGDGFDNGSLGDELAIGDLNATRMAAATEVTVGNNFPHENTQPSIVVGVWRRIQ